MVHRRAGGELRYNLFRRRTEPELCCAAPEDRPVPAFVEAAGWEYAGTLCEADIPPVGFDRAEARRGVQLNGFHVFQVAGRTDKPILVRPPSAVSRPENQSHAQSCHRAGTESRSARPGV